jgi:hypothetical protein
MIGERDANTRKSYHSNAVPREEANMILLSSTVRPRETLAAKVAECNKALDLRASYRLKASELP